MRRMLLAPAALAATFALAACGEVQPTAPMAVAEAATPAPPSMAKAGSASIVGDVTGTVTNAVGQAGTFTGTATLTSVATNAAGELVGTLTITGTTLINGVTSALTTTTTQTIQTGGECPVLDLDVGAIHLDLLGLQVDLAPINLDIVAQSGAGNLVGNLLCTVVHLLDGPAAIIAILNLLDKINMIIGAL